MFQKIAFIKHEKSIWSSLAHLLKHMSILYIRLSEGAVYIYGWLWCVYMNLFEDVYKFRYMRRINLDITYIHMHVSNACTCTFRNVYVIYINYSVIRKKLCQVQKSVKLYKSSKRLKLYNNIGHVVFHRHFLNLRTSYNS